MVAVDQLAATQPRFAAVQNQFRRFGMDIITGVGALRPGQGYADGLTPETHRAGDRAAVRTVHQWCLRRGHRRLGVEATPRPSAPCPASGRRHRTATSRARRSAWISPCPNTFGLLAEMDAFIEAEIKPLEREHIRYFDRRRDSPAPTSRTAASRGGEWEDLLDEMRCRADAAGGCATACRRSSGPRRHQPDMAVIRGTPGAQGSRPAQRPAGRVVDRRQLPADHHDGPVRHRRAEGRVDRGDADRQSGRWPSAHRTRAAAATPPGWRPTAVRDGTTG